MYAVILAGGGGTRLWPLSRPETPKPFLPLTGDRSLLQIAVDRIADHPELALGRDDVTVVTDRRYASLVTEQVPGVGIIAEPMGRNTAPAVTLATLSIERDPDEVMVVLPADQLIESDREGVFRSVLREAATLANGAFGIESPLVTLGIQVTEPSTQYGYLIPDFERGEQIDGLDAYPLQAFEEKPDQQRAAVLQRQPGVAWNAGIFLWRRETIRASLERHTGLLTLIGTVAGSRTGLEAAYAQLKATSIDRAVMEGAASDGRVVMAAMDVGWSDLGGWSALLAAVGATGSGRVIPAGTPAEAGPEDLIVERVDGRLVVSAGPRAILAASPTALLAGAATTRPAVEALVDRVSRWEDRA
jgi:mannose-1-phosphate guanylyltransferase